MASSSHHAQLRGDFLRQFAAGIPAGRLEVINFCLGRVVTGLATRARSLSQVSCFLAPGAAPLDTLTYFARRRTRPGRRNFLPGFVLRRDNVLRRHVNSRLCWHQPALLSYPRVSYSLVGYSISTGMFRESAAGQQADVRNPCFLSSCVSPLGVFPPLASFRTISPFPGLPFVWTLFV